jgi:Flp pilus assembly pilin Flp
MKRFCRWIRRQRGATISEYAFTAALIGVLVIPSAASVGQKATCVFARTESEIQVAPVDNLLNEPEEGECGSSGGGGSAPAEPPPPPPPDNGGGEGSGGGSSEGGGGGYSAGGGGGGYG